jgi:hypothetical protein
MDPTKNGLRRPAQTGKKKKSTADPRMGLREALFRVYAPKVGKAVKDTFSDTSKNYSNMHKRPQATVPFSDPTKRSR